MSIQSQINAAPTLTDAEVVSGAVPPVVIIEDGTYYEDAIVIGKPLILRSRNRYAAKLISSASWAIAVDANFVTIDGLDIFGPVSDSHAIQNYDYHHFTVINCIIHGAGGNGIACCGGDFYTIEGNICHSNARMSWYSGISIYHPIVKPGTTPANGFRNVIRNNVCYDNFTGPTGAQTDGNGIIIDDFRNNQEGDPWVGPSYTYPTLVENNLCFRNGSKGIAVNMSDFVTLRRNTCFGNNGDSDNDATWRGDLSVQSSADCTIEGNIAVCDPTTNPSSTAIGSYGDENIRNVWIANMAWPADRALNVSGPNADVSDLTIADPLMPGTSKPKQATGSVTFIAEDWIPANPAAANLGWRGSVITLNEETTMAITAELRAKITARQTASIDLGTAVADIAVEKVVSLTNGTTANKADLIFTDERTLAASASEDLDLAGTLTDAFGATITMVEVVAIYVEAAAGNTNNVVIGDATAPVPLFGGTNPTFSVKPGGFFFAAAPNAAGMFTVGAGTTDDLKVANSSSGTSVTYKVVILGRSA